MKIKARFEKVSFEQYTKDSNENRQIYDVIKLPCRATVSSAGYDFFAPNDIALEPKQTITIATGIRAIMPSDYFLAIFPRSGLGFKYRLRLNNTVGIIDADYAESDNEGHILICMTNEGDKPLTVEKGKAFAQGIFMQYFVTEDDDVKTKRNGGLGSTSKVI